MNHLTIQQLLELREPGLEPGLETARHHLDTCPACRAEADRLAQRVARLRALPEPRPGRDQFQAIRIRYVADRRRKLLRRTSVATLALAATVALAVVLRPAAPGQDRGIPTRVAQQAPEESDSVLQAMIARSQQLEAALRSYDPDSRVIDGRTATIAAHLEDQLGAIDRQLEMTQAVPQGLSRHGEQVRLWRERVGLLDALVDVHLTRASYVGM